MEKHTQTIINVCLAIFVATTIYNTNQLNDRIDYLELNSNLLASTILMLQEHGLENLGSSE